MDLRDADEELEQEDEAAALLKRWREPFARRRGGARRHFRFDSAEIESYETKKRHGLLSFPEYGEQTLTQ